MFLYIKFWFASIPLRGTRIIKISKKKKSRSIYTCGMVDSRVRFGTVGTCEVTGACVHSHFCRSMRPKISPSATLRSPRLLFSQTSVGRVQSQQCGFAGEWVGEPSPHRAAFYCLRESALAARACVTIARECPCRESSPNGNLYWSGTCACH